MNAPKPPNVQATAAAQTASNQSTAISQQLLNMVNQKDPYGSSTYSQSGTSSYFDPSLNKTVDLPRFTQTTTLNPEQQHLLDQQNQFAGMSNDIGLAQTKKIGTLLGTPFSYNSGDHEKWSSGLYDKLNGDADARKMEQVRQGLANQGLQPGSAAYDDAMRNHVYGTDKARNDFMLNSYDEGLNTALTMRNQPLNETSALMNGGQVTQPNFTATPNVGVNGTDIAGMTQANYNARNANYQAKLGGLAGLGGAAISGGWALSDERAKTDIQKVGETGLPGVHAYKFRYKGSPLMQMGAMAQEVEKKVPAAVKTAPSGLKMVNYGKLKQAMAA